MAFTLLLVILITSSRVMKHVWYKCVCKCVWVCMIEGLTITCKFQYSHSWSDERLQVCLISGLDLHWNVGLECGTRMWDWTFNWNTGQHYIWSIQSRPSIYIWKYIPLCGWICEKGPLWVFWKCTFQKCTLPQYSVRCTKVVYTQVVYRGCVAALSLLRSEWWSKIRDQPCPMRQKKNVAPWGSYRVDFSIT